MPSQVVVFTKAPGSIWEIPVQIEVRPEMAGGWRVEQEFIDAIRGKGPVTHTTFEDGVRYMEFTDAVLKSSRSGKTVYLPM